MNKLLALIIILLLNACFIFNGNKIEMKIKNESGQTITDVEFSTTEKLDFIKIERIEPNESVTQLLSLKKNKTDGAYTLSFIRSNDKLETHKHGYYTNGTARDYSVEYIIEKDTTIVNFVPYKY